MTAATPALLLPRRGLWIGLGVAALGLVVATAVWFGKGTDSPGASAVEPAPVVAGAGYASIAVLPFINNSEDAANEYFSDGLSEELLNVLSQIRNLKVAGRTSSFQFKDRTEDLRIIGEKLGVTSILDGSVRKAGNKVRITVQLVNAADGFHLWSQSYDRTLEDIFAVQDDIAASVAEALEVTLLGDRADASQARSRNAEAYNLLLQGQHFLKLESKDSLARAEEYFDKALAIDPGYAAAWAGLAEARSVQAGQAYLPFDEGFRLAREAATRAVELDENLAEGWAALGNIKVVYDWDWAGAEVALGKARALAPGNPTVLIAAAGLSSALGRSDQAIAFARRAVELDPLSAPAQAVLEIYLMRAGHLQEAEVTAQKVLELQPGRGFAHLRLGILEIFQSRPEAALAEIEMESVPHWRSYGLALVYHALGRRQAADAVLAEAKEENGDDMAFQFAEIHAFRGEPEASFDWLERAYTHRDPGLQLLKTSPFLANLHDDPRWPVFLEKMGLPQ